MPDGRSLEQALINVLVQEALRGKHRLQAIMMIFDRLEGKATALKRQKRDYDAQFVDKQFQGAWKGGLLKVEDLV